jgi:hypothetical protein
MVSDPQRSRTAGPPTWLLQKLNRDVAWRLGDGFRPRRRVSRKLHGGTASTRLDLPGARIARGRSCESRPDSACPTRRERMDTRSSGRFVCLARLREDEVLSTAFGRTPAVGVVERPLTSLAVRTDRGASYASGQASSNVSDQLAAVWA